MRQTETYRSEIKVALRANTSERSENHWDALFPAFPHCHSGWVPHRLLFGFLNIIYPGATKSQKCMGREKGSVYRLIDARFLWGL